uniref:DUF4220 domain-containing protein n=1 Tax=Oryza punctata TaxID=4537 RepID=A0A0E0JEI3_ORYPU
MDLHISRHRHLYNPDREADDSTIVQLKEECEKLSKHELITSGRLPSSEPKARKNGSSLEEIKEMWTRMLVYALGEGLELLTFVWLLMIHHGLGDAATEVKLLTSDDPSLPELGDVVALFRK